MAVAGLSGQPRALSIPRPAEEHWYVTGAELPLRAASFPRYRLRDLISASLPVTQHFLLVFLFVTAFHHLLEGGSTILVTRDLPAAFTLFVCSWTAGPGEQPRIETFTYPCRPDHGSEL